MQIEINPDALFTTGEVGRMLSIDGKRVQYMCDNGHIPCVKSKAGQKGHYRIAFKDFGKVLEADKVVRKAGRNAKKDARIEALESRVELLERLYDEQLAPVSDPR